MQIYKFSQLRLGIFRKKIRLFSYSFNRYSDKTKDRSLDNWRLSGDKYKNKIKTQSELTKLILKNKSFSENRKFTLDENLIHKPPVTKRKRDETIETKSIGKDPKSNSKFILDFFSNSDTNESKIISLEKLVRKKPDVKPKNFQQTKSDIFHSPEISAQKPSFNSDKAKLVVKEKAFLDKASYKIRNDLLDEKGNELLKTFASLSGQSTDPIHMTILHDNFSTRLSNLFYEKIFQNNNDKNLKNIWIEYNPGFGLVTRKLIEKFNENATTRQKFLLLEPLGKFSKYLNEIVTLNEAKHDVTVMKVNPYEREFLFKTSKFKYSFINNITTNQSNPASSSTPKCQVKETDVNEKVCMNIFGIVPWNRKGFVSTLFSDYASNRGLFSLGKTKMRNYFFHEIQENKNANGEQVSRSILFPEFYFYLPEITVAKLRAGYSKEYFRFNSPLSIFSYAFCKTEILDEEKCDYFFPYPIMSQKLSRLDGLDFKKMFLVSIKFHEDKTKLDKEDDDDLFDQQKTYSGMIRNKHLFFLFINHLFSRPSEPLRNSLKNICKDVDFVCKENSITSYLPVRNVQIHKFATLYNYLLDNKSISNLDLLSTKYGKNEVKEDSLNISFDQSNSKKEIITRNELEFRNKTDLATLKSLNKNFSGQFLIPFSDNTELNDSKPIIKEPKPISNNEQINKKDIIRFDKKKRELNDDHENFTQLTVNNFC